MSIVMSGHETCKYGKKIERKNSWARECIFSSHRPQKSMKNKRINIKEEKFRILLENWSRYRSEEISPGATKCQRPVRDFSPASRRKPSTSEKRSKTLDTGFCLQTKTCQNQNSGAGTWRWPSQGDATQSTTTRAFLDWMCWRTDSSLSSTKTWSTWSSSTSQSSSPSPTMRWRCPQRCSSSSSQKTLSKVTQVSCLRWPFKFV